MIPGRKLNEEKNEYLHRINTATITIADITVRPVPRSCMKSE